MSFTGSIISRLEAEMTSLLPRYTSRTRDDINAYQLDSLPSPSEHMRGEGGSEGEGEGGSANVMERASATPRDPPFSPRRSEDSIRDVSTSTRAYQNYEPNALPPQVWRPSYPSSASSPHAKATNNRLSFFDSIFRAPPANMERSSSARIDQSFKLMERRERQMQRELQRLLDAQDYALEKHLASSTPDDNATQHSDTLASDTPNGHIIPVRQPKKRHLSKREARLGISRCMSLLSDLKNEEEAYIATALAERKTALSTLHNLSTKRDSIVAEMEAIESDRDQPLKSEIGKMEHQHRTVCEDIMKMEAKLRDLKRIKAKLESRITEARSARDSELSGYKGALNECDKRIDDIMNYPEIPIIEVEGLMAQDADLRAIVGQHISGFEFLSLRPERRTPPMAKDWWEGEVQVLELRKVAVDKERSALDEGRQLWQDTVRHLEEHDRQLKSTFDAMSKYTSQQQDSGSGDLCGVLKKQYVMCRETAHKLEELYGYTEAQGWKLLVTALGAELNYFHGLKTQLQDTLHFMGWADGVVTPRSGTPPRINLPADGSLLDENNDDSKTGLAENLEEELTGSVLRRWGGTDELRRSTFNTNTSTLAKGALGRTRRRADSDNGNEVPTGLLSEARHESDDEHNDIPVEFLSMHSPSPKSRKKGKGKMIATSVPELGGKKKRAGHKVEPENEDDDDGDDDDREERRVPLSRESSANEVPPDLLSENRRDLD